MATHQMTTNKRMEVSFVDETSGVALSVEGTININYTWEWESDWEGGSYEKPAQLNYWVAERPFSVINLQTKDETLVEAVDLTENQLKEIQCLIELCID